MRSDPLDRLLTRLEALKGRFGDGDGARTERVLAQFDCRTFDDAESLIRFHEVLLFLRAYPQSPEVLQRTESVLSSFHERIERLAASGADMTPFDYIEASGIAGTAISGRFSYEIVRWLAERYPSEVNVDWDRYERTERLGATLSLFLPLLHEESLVEANIPYREYLRAVTRSNKRGVHWLLDRFEELPRSRRERAGLYDLLELPIRWELGATRASRTRLRRKVQKVFFHTGPLIRRSEVSLSAELDSPPIPVEKLSRRAGEAILDMVRETTTVRYRELYGITHGDPGSVVRAEVGRGVEVFLWGLPRERRLPLRGYHAGFTLKNGVPVNYIEAITLFERTEVGFNTFYTYRDGETAWVYARVLRLLRQMIGVTCISIDPYQLGFNNDEAIESGAFWFYRKLGFRPTRPDLLRLTEAEEAKIARRAVYRTPARVLRRLSEGPAIYEHEGTGHGEWDLFRIRNLGLAVARRMATRYASDPARSRQAAAASAARALGLDRAEVAVHDQRAFEDFALVLALIPDLHRWPAGEKRLLTQIISAKTKPDEARYVRLLQRHRRLREAIIKLGSDASR
ncbi:MAG TPA: hypothetical protein VJH03_20425 [Blastocatellia bacterium]|nr:hypothetical protein [Blastocatellia bacterium]